MKMKSESLTEMFLISERVLTLDLSSKTGYNLVISSDEGIHLEAYGQVPKIECPESSYPVSYVLWAHEIFNKIEELVIKYSPDTLLIEETCAGSKNVYSQKLLEWSHFLVAKLIKDTGIKSVYMQTGVWRKEASSYMNSEEKLHNKEVAKYKKQNNTKIARDIKGKRIGKITKKHVAIRRANEVFGKYFDKPLRKKDEDLADSLCISLAYHNQRLRRN
jgi:hypothetical protein